MAYSAVSSTPLISANTSYQMLVNKEKVMLGFLETLPDI